MIGTKHTEGFVLKIVSKRNEANILQDFKNLDYKIIHFNITQRNNFLTIDCVFNKVM